VYAINCGSLIANRRKAMGSGKVAELRAITAALLA